MVRSGQEQMAELDSPAYQAEALRDDINPRRLLEVDQALAARGHQHPRQQASLQEERRRLEDIQGQMMMRAAQQQFSQRLEQRINPRIGTPEDTDPQARAQFMARLMMQMQRRHGMGAPGLY